ncbi:MAG TPA: ester cyclase [Thermomicrobiales bacterium]|jgi:predicted ester cyclase|nr:ester cyclase [Thermomicrobiales bacterium]
MTGEPAAIVRRYYDDVFAARNLDALADVIASDFVGHAAGYGDYSAADMRRDLAREFAATPDDQVVIDDQLVAGDRVVTRWRYRWRHIAPLFGERPTGEWLEMDGVHIDRIGDGKIVERWEIKDFWSVVHRLGGTVAMPPASGGAGKPTGG